MKLWTDDQGQLKNVELFPPNSVFDAVRQADGSIRVQKITESEVPVVKMVRRPKGYLMLPVKLDRRKIAAAIRADRDAQ